MVYYKLLLPTIVYFLFVYKLLFILWTNTTSSTVKYNFVEGMTSLRVPGPEPEQNTPPLLTLFTTWNGSMESKFVYENTLRVWASMKPRVQLILFTGAGEKNHLAEELGWTVLPAPEVECKGVPTLRGMFQNAVEIYDSTFYGFANGDLLFNEGILDTLETLRKSPILSHEKVLVIGRRVDLLLDRYRIKEITSFHSVTDLALKGTVANGYNEDYFITTKQFPWEDIPEVVIGRSFFDHFLAFYSRNFLNFTIVDASASVFALHQKTVQRKKNYSKCNSDILKRYNKMKLSYLRHGNMECAQYESRYNRKGNVVFYKRGLFTTKC